MAAFSSSTGICPGAETWPTAPKVMAEPKYSPHRRLTTPAPMDMVMMGRSAYFPLISWVASSRAMTSPGHRGITAIFGMSAPSSCIFRRRKSRSALSGVPPKSWLEPTTAFPAAWMA